MEDRIDLGDNIMTVITKLSDGNPGAMNAILALYKAAPTIDPDSSLGGIGPLLALDSHRIYGSDIYILHNYLCNSDPVKTIAVLRAASLGFIPGYRIKEACHRQDRPGLNPVDVENLYNQVRVRLPNFDKSSI